MILKNGLKVYNAGPTVTFIDGDRAVVCEQQPPIPYEPREHSTLDYGGLFTIIIRTNTPTEAGIDMLDDLLYEQRYHIILGTPEMAEAYPTQVFMAVIENQVARTDKFELW